MAVFVVQEVPNRNVLPAQKYGELILIKADFNSFKAQLSTKPNFNLEGKKDYIGEIYGGEVGIILDGRGRPFNFKLNTQDRKKLVHDWQLCMNEYPGLEI